MNDSYPNHARLRMLEEKVRALEVGVGELAKAVLVLVKSNPDYHLAELLAPFPAPPEKGP